jgi:hypothetical protein
MPEARLKQILPPLVECKHEPLTLPFQNGSEPSKLVWIRVRDKNDDVREVEVQLCRKCGLVYGMWTPGLEAEPITQHTAETVGAIVAEMEREGLSG